jgi:tRNA pseudouridine55 synthase
LTQAGEADGYLLLNKRSGITSFDALSQVKRALGTRRVGHSGTLDKFAEGLLVVLVGRSTRLVPWFTGCDKLYEGTIAFGRETDTLDPEGATVATAEAPSESALREIIPRFVGDLLQAPPIYSSVHVDGRRAHELARAGVDLEMKKRPVSIRELELLSYDGTAARIRVRCSKGTYIRSLARDIALAAGSRAHLAALCRLEVANFRVEDAADPAASDDPAGAVREGLRRIDMAAFAAIGAPTTVVTAQLSRLILNGRPIDPSWMTGAFVSAAKPFAGIFDEEGRFLAVAEYIDGTWKYGYVASRTAAP